MSLSCSSGYQCRWTNRMCGLSDNDVANTHVCGSASMLCQPCALFACCTRALSSASRSRGRCWYYMTSLYNTRFYRAPRAHSTDHSPDWEVSISLKIEYTGPSVLTVLHTDPCRPGVYDETDRGLPGHMYYYILSVLRLRETCQVTSIITSCQS